MLDLKKKKKNLHKKKKDFLDSRNVVCGYLQPLYAHRRFTTPPLGMTQIHTPPHICKKHNMFISFTWQLIWSKSLMK